MARVTVCIPTYRRTQWLAGTIESALAQTFTDLVVEVHDDATPGDAVAEVVARFDDPRLTLVRHETNAGHRRQLHALAAAAPETEYVLQLGDDDEAAPAAGRGDRGGARRAPERGRRARALRADRRRRRRSWWREQDWLGTPSPPLETRRRLRREFDGPRLPRLQLDGADPARGGPRGRVPRGGLPAVRLRVLVADGRALGRRVRRRAAVPLPDARRQPHVSAQRPDGHRLPAGRADAPRGARRQAPARRDAAGEPRRAELERAADRALRRDLVGRVRERTLPDRPFGATVRGLAGTPCAASRRCCASRPRGRCWPAAWSARARSSG